MSKDENNTKPAVDKSRLVEIVCNKGDDPELAIAVAYSGPFIINANVTAHFAQGSVGEMLPLAQLTTAFSESAKRVSNNDFKDVEALLMSQATALNMMFGELSRRAAVNMGTYIPTSETYLRMALKAQNQCRMTLETLSNLKNPPTIYAKQANIANGPQQVNNHAHATENKNQPNKVLEQSHEQRMDTGTQSQASSIDSRLEAVEQFNRPEDY